MLETWELGPPAAEGEPAGPSSLRTSVMTHIAWVPQSWRKAAEATLAGLGEAHPSRTIILFPQPDAQEGELGATVELYCLPKQEDRRVFSEVVSITLPGSKSHVPASIVTPLLRSDLPVFLRWRGELPFGTDELVQLVAIADRLIVDSREWPRPEEGYGQLPALFEQVAVSDIAWSRLDPWREATGEALARRRRGGGDQPARLPSRSPPAVALACQSPRPSDRTRAGACGRDRDRRGGRDRSCATPTRASLAERAPVRPARAVRPRRRLRAGRFDVLTLASRRLAWPGRSRARSNDVSSPRCTRTRRGRSGP